VIRREIRTLKVGPPFRASAAAGHLVCSLLRQDPVQRLGTAAESPVSGAPFFMAVDWHAARAGQLRPAFAPPPASFRPKDRVHALKNYAAVGAKLSACADTGHTEAGAAAVENLASAVAVNASARGADSANSAGTAEEDGERYMGIARW